MPYREIPHQLAMVNRKCTVDLYIRIREEYRVFAARGAILPEEQLQRYAKERLYALVPDDVDPQEHQEALLLEILTDPEVSPQEKADITYQVSMKAIREVFEITNHKTLSALEKVSKQVVRLILADGRVVDKFIGLTSRDHYTFVHQVKVGIYGTAMAVNLFGDSVHDHDLDRLSMGFFLHDIGMTKVPATILNKEEPLLDSEWDTIRKHPLWGQERLRKAVYRSDEADDIILYHHERCNGNGYPFGKTGGEIPLYARICAIADTFESLTAHRPFKSARSPFEALKIMKAEMANEFDPDLFRAFIMLLGPRG